MARFDFVLKQFRLEDEGLKPRRGQSTEILNKAFSLGFIAKASGVISSPSMRFAQPRIAWCSSGNG